MGSAARPAWRLLCAAVLLGCVVLTGGQAAASGQEPTDEASRTESPTQDDAAGGVLPPAGTEVVPGPNAVHALQVDVGTYRAAFPAKGDNQFFEYQRKWPGSRLVFGVAVADYPDRPPLHIGMYGDGEFIKFCAGFPAVVAGIPEGIPGEQATALFSDQESKECRRSDSMVLQLRNYEQPAKAGLQYQLTVWEEPPADNADELPEPSTLTWEGPGNAQPTEVTPGRTFVDAPTLTDGSWSFTLEPGQMPWFRIFADWGQHIELRMETRGDGSDNFYDDLSASWMSPMGGQRDPNYTVPGGDYYGLNLDEPDTADTGVPAIAWRDGEQMPDNSNGIAPFIPGPWFLGLVSDNSPRKGIDVTLHVKVVQDYDPVPPDYVAEPPPVPALDGRLYAVASLADPTPASPTASPGAVAGGTAAAGLPERDRVPWPAVTMLLGAAVLSTALGLVLLGRARRRPGPSVRR